MKRFALVAAALVAGIFCAEGVFAAPPADAAVAVTADVPAKTDAAAARAAKAKAAADAKAKAKAEAKVLVQQRAAKAAAERKARMAAQEVARRMAIINANRYVLHFIGPVWEEYTYQSPVIDLDTGNVVMKTNSVWYRRQVCVYIDRVTGLDVYPDQFGNPRPYVRPRWNWGWGW